MMRIIYALSCLTALGAGAVSKLDETSSFRIGDHWVVFLRNPAQHFTISATCSRKNGQLGCDAYAALKKVSMKTLAGELAGGVEPGAVMCVKALAGKVVLGVDRQRNENSFCQLRDGSMVSLGGLAYHARKNDSAK